MPINLICHLSEDESWKRDTEGQQPDRHSHNDAGPQRAVSCHCEGVHDDHVSVQSHENHREDAANEPGTVGDGGETAHEVAKGPLAGHSVVSIEGQRYDKEEVSEGKVEEADVCQVALVTMLNQDTENQTISWQEKNERQ